MLDTVRTSVKQEHVNWELSEAHREELDHVVTSKRILLFLLRETIVHLLLVRLELLLELVLCSTLGKQSFLLSLKEFLINKLVLNMLLNLALLLALEVFFLAE